MMTKWRRATPLVSLVLLAAAGPGGAAGQEGGAAAAADTLLMTLEEAESLALTRNPALAAARREEGIAEGRLEQAGTYRFNPSVELEARTLDAGPGAGVLGGYEAVVAQEIEWAGQWGLREDAATHAAVAAGFSATNAARRTLREVRSAYYGVVAARSKARVADRIADVTERLRDAVRAELEAGEVSALDANLAEIEYGRGQARTLGAERDLESARLELKRVLGLEPGTPIRVDVDTAAGGAARASGGAPSSAGPDRRLPPPATLDADSLVWLALEARPDLWGADATVEEAADLERLARRERIPNLRLSVPVERRSASGDPEVGLGVGLSVPIWNRSQGRMDARRAAVLQARDLRRSVALEIRTEVRDALQAYRSASEEAGALSSSVLGPAATNAELLEESYRAGKIDLSSLLLLQNQLLDAQIEYWDAWLARHRAWVRLRAAVGDRSVSREDAQP